MKKLIFILSLLVSSLAFGLGAWYDTEGEILIIKRNANKVVFTRKDATRVLATGEITMVNGDMHINRYDTNDAYRLGLFIGNETMVVNKPNSYRAWLWIRIQ
jgi:hypothetical protein